MTERTVEHISLEDSLGSVWLKLPYACMRDCGPAVQTLGGLLRITTTQTFVKAETIAERTRLPIATVRKHLKALGDAGWVKHLGRGKTPKGRPRRTATIRLERKTEFEPYGFLPWWAARSVKPWSARALLSVMMMQLCKLNSASGKQECGPDSLLDMVMMYGAEERFRWSITALEKLTGLSPHSVIAAKKTLKRIGIIDWTGDSGTADLLVPDFDFRVSVTPADEGRCTIRFVKESADAH